MTGFRGPVSERDIRAEFRRFGQVDFVEDLRERGTLITFASIDEAGKCIDKLNGKSLGPPLRASNLKLEFTDPPHLEQEPERSLSGHGIRDIGLDRGPLLPRESSMGPSRQMRSPSMERRRLQDQPPPSHRDDFDRNMYRDVYERHEHDRFRMGPPSMHPRDVDPREMRDFRERNEPRDFRRPTAPGHPTDEFGREPERHHPMGLPARSEFAHEDALDSRARLRMEGVSRAFEEKEMQLDSGMLPMQGAYPQAVMDYPPPPPAVAPPPPVMDFHRYPVSWRGQLSLKSTSVAVRMHLVSGHQELLAVLPLPPGPIKIAQRLRLTQLEPLARCLQAGPEFYCMLLVRPGFSDDDAASYAGALTTHFVLYLLDKQAAGIVQAPMGTLYILPPCEFALQYLSQAAPSLDPQLALSDHLLLVITRPGT